MSDTERLADTDAADLEELSGLLEQVCTYIDESVAENTSRAYDAD